MKRALLTLALLCSSATAADVLRANNDANGTAVNSEVLIAPSSLSAGKFALLGSFNVDGLIFAQSLHASRVLVSSIQRDILIVSTLNNSVYAFDANIPGSAALWHVNYGTGRGAWSNNTDQFFYCLAACNLGIVSTPTIDATGGFIYLVSATSTPSYKIHKLNLTTGADSVTAVTISGQVTGTGSTGDTTSGANLLFTAQLSNQRPAIVLSPDASKVYISFGGGSAGSSNPPWHGWMFGYNTSNLTQFAAFCTTPNGYGGSIWAAGGPSVDASGNLYVVTGSMGDWDGVTEFSDSVLKLSPALVLLDWFTPSNHATLEANDYDFGSNRVMLIPGTTFAVAGGKDFNVYLIDTTCMGHLQGSSGCSFQTFQTTVGGTVTKFSGSYGAAFMNQILYLPTTAGFIYAFTWNGSSFTVTPLATETTSFGGFGPSAMSGSCNGSANCILWVVTTAGQSSFTSTHAGTLRARNPTTLAEYWNSDTSGTDTLGTLAKFVGLTITTTKVFAATQDSKVQVYGLIPSSTLDGQTTLGGKATIQ